MMIELTTQQQRLLDANHGQPAQFFDPRSQTAYVLISIDEYELLRSEMEAERVQKAIHRIALRNAIKIENC